MNHGGKREGAGRPPEEGEPRSRRFTILLTETRWRVIKALADRKKQSVSEYIRHLIETGVAK